VTDRKGIESYQLFAGDQITVSVTHQIQIGRDNSWVKYEAVTRLQPGETPSAARSRAIGHVNESVMEAVHSTVETVRNAS
jgi:hypothetical protein